ncbi:Lsr2 family protein [Curtobacterium sp. VKM Ac-2861]|uniref:Lsr2 dimerization domain-containing protein n=1 Tax=Curtobacterium sp. VKM Ac-2861 TaxID=2739016 RepID=UPI000DB811DD|nr:Lsr2 family protein [Curtobacterium sp. VKM Ac-2861]PZO60208.1 MAG: hypothetical protein DI639_05385 [Leifsonia xyli]
MALRVERVDDLTGESLPDGQPVRFSFDGVDYEIDLTPQGRARLRATFAPYIAAVRRARYTTTQLPRVERR